MVFMSDRAKGIIEGVKRHFPNSNHLYNVQRKNMDNFQFWIAEEATNSEEFLEAYRLSSLEATI